VPSFVKRASRYFQKALELGITPPTASLGNICTNAVRRLHDLNADRVLRKPAPIQNYFSDLVCQNLRQVINVKSFKISLFHLGFS